MQEFSEELAKGYFSGVLPILAGLFVFTILIIAIKLGISWLVSLIKEKIQGHTPNNKHQEKNKARKLETRTRTSKEGNRRGGGKNYSKMAQII